MDTGSAGDGRRCNKFPFPPYSISFSSIFIVIKEAENNYPNPDIFAPIWNDKFANKGSESDDKTKMLPLVFDSYGGENWDLCQR